VRRAISSLEDMEILFRGIPLGEVTVSMTINSPAAVLWAMYLAVAEQQGVDWAQLSGTLQNDILKEYIAQKEYIFPPRPSMRLVTDTIEFGARHTPRFQSDFDQRLSHSRSRFDGRAGTGVHAARRHGVRRLGAGARPQGRRIRAAPELLFQRAQRFLRRDRQVPRGAQDLGARHARPLRREGASAAETAFHAQTAGCSLTWQQPYNNVVRTALQAMAAVLGGAQSLHTNSLDEAYALPGEQAVTIALRTQQVLAYESGVTNTPDPLGGSYFLERLTLDTEPPPTITSGASTKWAAWCRPSKPGFPQTEIAAASYRYQREVESGERTIVGVNRFQSDGQPIELLQIDESSARASGGETGGPARAAR
jgi:methylmalonyl-CoA mutase, N-terminal domain